MTPEKTKSFAVAQIKRLITKPFFSAEAAPELARSLYQYSQSNEHMERIIDAARIRKFGNEGKEEDRVPSSHDIWALCREIDPVAPPPATGIIASSDCPHCNGTAWEVVERNGVEGVRKCRCGGHPPNHKPDEAWETPLTLTVNS